MKTTIHEGTHNATETSEGIEYAPGLTAWAYRVMCYALRPKGFGGEWKPATGWHPAWMSADGSIGISTAQYPDVYEARAEAVRLAQQGVSQVVSGVVSNIVSPTEVTRAIGLLQQIMPNGGTEAEAHKQLFYWLQSLR